jgi:hypothetical protein
VPPVSDAERVLIRLGALVHDIPHGPFSHDIEKKTHHVYKLGAPPPRGRLQERESRLKVKSHYGAYDKHDDFDSNPTLFVSLFDVERSVLARVLKKYSPPYWAFLQESEDEAIKEFVEAVRAAEGPEWKADREILPALLFHLLAFEDPEEAVACEWVTVKQTFGGKAEQWGFGPRDHWQKLHAAWYQPFRHDIIGNTLSADLIDYLQRDLRHLGIGKTLDLKLLKNYVLVEWKPKRYRCALDLYDRKRGMVRPERVNDIFRLLDLRQEIHEKAVFHRVVQGAIAMLSRAVLALGPNKPDLEHLYFPPSGTPALLGDEHFLNTLVDGASKCLMKPTSASSASADGSAIRPSNGNSPGPVKNLSLAHTLPFKLAERRIFRPLLIVPGDSVKSVVCELETFGEFGPEPMRRAFAAVLDSPRFSRFFLLISWCIEALLEHAFAHRAEMDAFLHDLQSRPLQLQKTRDLVPTRVIFWTTPYKQLYKDPALLVSVKGILATIQELPEKLTDGQHGSVRERIEAGIHDAETKYASLWALYLFVSDGLFHPGLLARCRNAEQRHVEQLKAAKEIALLALYTAWRYFLKVDSSNRELLTQMMSDEDLARILKIFLQEEEGTTRPDEAKFSPPVSEYAHDDREGRGRCRDVRYRFDLLASPLAASSLTETQQLAIDHLETRHQIVLGTLSAETALDFLGRVEALDKDAHQEFETLPEAARGPGPASVLLRVFLGPEGARLLREWDGAQS